jgi:dTDP-4-amino-4,6-dideoxygalactose transaminase
MAPKARGDFGLRRTAARRPLDATLRCPEDSTMTTASEPTADFARFAIGFDNRDRARLHDLIDEVLDSNRWSEAALNERFEAAWTDHNGAAAVALSSWAGGALAALDFAAVKGQTVLCPSNTFMATPLAAIRAGAQVQFVDCNRSDLCMSFADFERKAEQHKPKAAFLVHIGGHIAFDSEEIAAYCRENGIFLIEDCAHAHGASWNGRRPGTYGDAGIYSLYATKTISTGEGGVLVSTRPEVVEHVKQFRNYGKFDYKVHGLNFRMSEFTAALGLVQIERLPEIVAWKNETARSHLDPLYPARLELPDGMTSGLYKYIVFDWLEKSTGRVYDEPCHRILGHQVDLPNTDWVASHHSCPPLYYRPEV